MGGRNLTIGQRREIERLNADGVRPCEIVQAVGVTTATIYWEVKRGDTGQLNRHYRPEYNAAAERNAQACIRQRGRRKRREVTTGGCMYHDKL